MYTTLLLIRHGETAWNALGRIQGCTNIALSPSGADQAELLARRLNGCFTALYSSPLNRAYETAEILGKSKAVAPIKVEALREINFGAWEGLTFKEVATRYPDTFHTWLTDPVEAPMTDGEGSLLTCSLRGRHILHQLVEKHPGETIAIVSHGGFIKAALLGIFNLPMTMYHQLAMGNTCISEIRFPIEGPPVLVKLNDTSHLGALHVTSV